MGDNGNGEIRLSNNTIDNKATIVGAVSAVSPTKLNQNLSIIQSQRLQFPSHQRVR